MADLSRFAAVFVRRLAGQPGQVGQLPLADLHSVVKVPFPGEIEVVELVGVAIDFEIRKNEPILRRDIG